MLGYRHTELEEPFRHPKRDEEQAAGWLSQEPRDRMCLSFANCVLASVANQLVWVLIQLAALQ